MNKVPFVIIAILLITAVFVAVFSTNDGKNPLAALGDTTPTPSLNLINGTQTPNQQVQGQQAQQQAQPTVVVPTTATSDIITADMITIHTA